MTGRDEQKFQSDVKAILAKVPLQAGDIVARLDNGMSVKAVAARLRWMRERNELDSLLSARSTVWVLPGAFDAQPAPETPEAPEPATQPASQRPRDAVSLPYTPWNVEAAE